MVIKCGLEPKGVTASGKFMLRTNEVGVQNTSKIGDFSFELMPEINLART